MTQGKPFFLLIVTVIVLSLLYVRSRFLVLELSYHVNEMNSEKRLLEKRNRELNLELSVLQSPRRIEEKAKEKFGLRYENKGFQKKIFMKSRD